MNNALAPINYGITVIRLKKTATGVEMHDEVNYVLPFGILGTIAHKLFVRKRVEEIFEYRTKVVEKLFSSKN